MNLNSRVGSVKSFLSLNGIIAYAIFAFNVHSAIDNNK